ncbi:MAG TPA: hypothetical protein VI037_00515 [Nitrososphaera sp.]
MVNILLAIEFTELHVPRQLICRIIHLHSFTEENCQESIYGVSGTPTAANATGGGNMTGRVALV